MALQVRESQIEDALAGASEITRQLLGLQNPPSLLGRQIILPSGRLDLLYSHRAKLLLLELKVVRFRRDFLRQISGYKTDLANLQQKGELLQGEIEAYLLCPEAGAADKRLAEDRGIQLTEYDPRAVLQLFYRTFKPVAFYAETKPIDIGVWNVHLINELLYALESVNSVAKLQEKLGASKTLSHKLHFAAELRLINRKSHRNYVALTNLGRKYAKQKDDTMPRRLSDGQAALLAEFIMENPYESSITLGVSAVVETVYILSKNTHPVSMEQLIAHFPAYAGKHFDWKTPKARFNGTRMYSNYAADLGLLAKTQNDVYLTPEGLRFTMQMQMHKNLKIARFLRFS